MFRFTGSVVAALILASLVATPVLAEHTIWHSPLPARVAAFSSDLDIEPGIPQQCLRVTALDSGDLLWADFPLTLPSDVEIIGVIVCYENAAASRYISQVRLTRLTTPDAATVIHDDGTDLTTPSMDCYYSEVFPEPVDGTITLSLRFHFNAPGEYVEVGGIGIVVESTTADFGGDYEPDPTGALELRSNRPNPFAHSTTIAYALDQEELVDLEILDVSGRVVRTLFRGHQPGGEYRMRWDGTSDTGNEMASGKYYYRIQAGDEMDSRGMIMLK